MGTNPSFDPEITKAPEEFVARRQQKRLLELFGKLEWDKAFDYERERTRMHFRCQNNREGGMVLKNELSLDDPVVRKAWFRNLLRNAQAHARAKPMPFDLPKGWIEELYQRQKGRCDVSDYPFSFKSYENALVKHPFAPSIDRRLSTGGYTRDNVRLVCVAVNFGMGEWGDEVYLILAQSAVERGRGGARPPGGVDWSERQRERIKAVEDLLPTLPASEQIKLRRRIAGLKSALTKGPEKLKEAARRAHDTIGAQFGEGTTV